MRREKIKEENKDSGQLENINKSLRENKTDEGKTAVFENIKFIKKITAVFEQVDLKRFGIALAVVLIVVTLFSFVIPAMAETKYVEAYQVYLNDKSIGAMSDVSRLEAMIAGIYDEHEAYYGMEVSKDIQLSYFPVSISEQFLCPAEYYEEILRNSMDVKVIAWVITVNNTSVIALKNREDAQWILEQLLSPYKDEADENRSGVGFLEEVEISSEAISFEKVVDRDTALRIMLYGDDIEVTRHKVVSGESLYSICKSYSLKLSDIKKANPSVANTNKIYPGDVLIVSKVYNIVNVKYTEYEERVEEMPYETIVIEDDTMYTTQSIVRQDGIVGLRNIKANVVYINGSEASYEVLVADTPTREPVDKIVVRGTKAMPNVLVLANEGRMPLPLSSYTITSEFGYRETGIDGASTFHKGIDLAAPKGTPIYASADGKVSFAGSSSGYGQLVKISHDGGVETRYGHCSTILVSSGQYVKRGDVIALVGSTGVSSGNHVHFEVRINGTPVNPLG